MEIYIKLFEVLFPVFFVVGVGYYLGKTNPKIDTTFITNFRCQSIFLHSYLAVKTNESQLVGL